MRLDEYVAHDGTGLARLLAVRETLGLRNPGHSVVKLLGPCAGPALVVAFAPGATEADLRALLLDLDLVIVDGLSALGLYRLVPASGSAEDLAAAAAALAAAADLVDSVEPEGE